MHTSTVVAFRHSSACRPNYILTDPYKNRIDQFLSVKHTITVCEQYVITVPVSMSCNYETIDQGVLHGSA